MIISYYEITMIDLYFSGQKKEEAPESEPAAETKPQQEQKRPQGIAVFNMNYNRNSLLAL